MLIQAERLPKEPAGAISNHRATNGLGRDNPKTGPIRSRSCLPVGDQGRQDQPAPLLAKAAEFRAP